MYCLISETQLRESEYNGDYWRGSLLKVKATHNEPMPFIVCALPSEMFNHVSVERFIQYVIFANRGQSETRNYILCKAMATPDGVTYQIIARGRAGMTRDDGEYTQRRMSLIAASQVDDNRLSYFNDNTRRVLSLRATDVTPDFDALTMFYQDANLRYDPIELQRFKEALGNHYEGARDLDSFRQAITQTYQQEA